MVGSHLFGIHPTGLVSKRADSSAGPLGKILGCSQLVFYNPTAALGSRGKGGQDGAWWSQGGDSGGWRVKGDSASATNPW